VTVYKGSSSTPVTNVTANAYGVYGVVLPTGSAYRARATAGFASGEATLAASLAAVGYYANYSFNGYVGESIASFSTTKVCTSTKATGNAYGLDVQLVRQPREFHVDAATPEDYADRDGSAEHPYKDLNEVSPYDGDTVYLAAGTYESTLTLDDPSARVKLVARDFPSETLVRPGLQAAGANVEVWGVTFAGQVQGGRLVNCRVCGVADMDWNADTSSLVPRPAVAGATLVGCLVAGNAGRGAESSTLVNCTVTRNGRGGLDAASSAVNTIVWGNAGANVAEGAALDHCVTDVDPRFVDADAGDYRLRKTSPCLDAGDNASLPADVATDLANAVRIQNASVDLGAYEGAVWVPFDRSEQTAPSVLTFTSYGGSGGEPHVPRVLYFGTRCESHGLSTEALLRSLNAIKASADVDWYLFGNYNDSNNGLYKSGTLACGAADITSSALGSSPLTSSKHYALRSFLDRFKAILTASATSNAYDYIVIETDGSRLANQYGQSGGKDGSADTALELQVARLLKPFYAKSRVIWLLDDGFDYYHSTGNKNYFNYVSNSSAGLSLEIFQYGSRCDNGAGRPYRVNNGLMKNSGGSGQYLYVLTDAQWKGLLAVFDPQLYLDIAEGRNGGRLYAGDDGCIANAKILTDTKQNTGTATLYAGHPYACQAWYDSAHLTDMVAYLKGAIVPTVVSGPVMLADTARVGTGKRIVAVRLMAATTDLDTSADGWTELMSWDAASPEHYDCSGEAGWLSSQVGGSGAIDLSQTRVRPDEGTFSWALTNVTTEVWLKAEVRVVDRPITSYETASFTVTPYVQHPTADAMSVLFFTASPIRGAVRCWPEGDERAAQVALTTGVEATDLVATGHSTDEPVWGTQYRHRVRFDGLTAGTPYRYEVELEDGTTYANAFRTAPDRDTPVKFVAYSDSETTPKDAPDADGWDVRVGGQDTKRTYYVSRSVGFAANIRHMRAWEPDLIVIAGDLVARGGVQMFWDEFWRHNAGANAKGFNDPAGSTPILATVGNHDLYDNKNQDAYAYSHGEQGERALKHYLSYFEYNPNGVDYANAGEAERDSRDKSQLFHREDYGPVTLLFLDTTNGDDSDKTKDTNTNLSRNGSTGARAPDFNEGSLQYRWLERNLADAREKARFVFVVSHHCPFSVGKHNFANGKHNGDEYESHSGQPVRALLPLLHRYGVTAWLCGHDEIQERSRHVGVETLPNGKTRDHVLNIYDLGSAGDGLRGKMRIENPYEAFRAYEDAEDGVHYGHLQVEVRPNAKGVWQCILTPAYSFMNDGSGKSELRAYDDRIVIDEATGIRARGTRLWVE